MPKNELLDGDPRLGWLVDGDSQTNPVAVMLRNTGESIELTLPLKGMHSSDDPYGRWWSSKVVFSDDPKRERHSYGPPRVLQFVDVSGSAILVGCRSTGSTTNFRAGKGQIVSNFAVLGGTHRRYEKINGLRAEIPALAVWTGMSSMEVAVESDGKGRATGARMELTNMEPTVLARRLNLSMHSRWSTQSNAGHFEANEGVVTQTFSQRPRSWNEHLDVHGAVLRLAALSAWQPFGFSSIWAQRDDDPSFRHPDGSTPTRWSPVVTHLLPKHEDWKKTPRFLFDYDEIGHTGIHRWLSMQQQFDQALSPIFDILYSSHMWSPSNLVQSGIALESLAYSIAKHINGGADLNKDGWMIYKTGLRVIIDSMNCSPFEDPEPWITRSHQCYMAAKHANRTMPDYLTQVNTLRENLLVLRYWIGQRLGVKSKTISARLPTDPLAQDFEIVD